MQDPTYFLECSGFEENPTDLSSCSIFRNLGEKTRLGRGWGTGIGGNPELFLKLTSVFWQRSLVWARCKRQAP